MRLKTVAAKASPIALGFVALLVRRLKARRRMRSEFEIAVETSPDCILFVNSAYKITFVNPAGEMLLGMSLDSILGKPVSGILPGISASRTPQGEFSLKAGGRELIVDATCGHFGETTTIFLRDITERKLAEFKIQQSETRLQRILDTLPGFVTEAEANGALTFVSARFIEYFGYAKGEAIVQTATCRHVHPDQTHSIAETKKLGYRSGQPFRFQQRVRRHDGVYRWFQVAAQPLTDSTGQVKCWYSLHTDIDDLVLAQDSIQRLQSQLALANQVATASELAASIVHEISQPVSAMVTNGQVGLNFLSSEPPNVTDSLVAFTRIVEDGQTTAAIVNGLRSLFNRSAPEMKPIDFGILLRNTSRRSQLESKAGSLLCQTHKLMFSRTLIHLGKRAFLVGLAGADKVIEDSREFVSSSGDRRGSAESTSHTTKVLSEIGLTTMKRLCCHTQCASQPVFHFTRSHG